VFVVHAQLLSRLRRLKEAHKALSDAKVVFAGTPQQLQVLVASAQLAVDRGDHESAVRMLDKVSADNSSFVRAQLLKADILLNHARDKEGYTACYRQLVDRDPTAKSHALLGQAYLRILNPEAAVGSLEEAFRLDPANTKLRARIGRALTATHEVRVARTPVLFCVRVQCALSWCPSISSFSPVCALYSALCRR
jgi:tetratricopeptide repeat protein 21B